VLTFRITGHWGETVDMKAVMRRIDLTLESLRALPGVESAATSLAAPGVPFDFQSELRILEGSTVDSHVRIVAATRVVSVQYFATMRIPLVAGEACAAGSNQPLAVVNRRFAELYLPGSPAVGRHIQQVPVSPFLPASRIVGVAADAREQGFNQAAGPIVYWCHNAPAPAPLFLVRTHGDPSALADTIRRRVREIEPSRSVYEMMPLEERLSDASAENRLRTALLTFFAATAMSLAAIGLYGTLSYFVSMRRREIGVRVAVGALGREIVGSFMKQALRVSAAGCIAGLWLAAALGRMLSDMLYGVSALDPATFAAVLAVMLLTAVLSSLWPALRAARIDPMRVLREE